MDNKQIARVLRDTAQLLEIDGAIIGRYRRSRAEPIGLVIVSPLRVNSTEIPLLAKYGTHADIAGAGALCRPAANEP